MVGKVTVSLPTELLARIEHRRRDRQASRSEVVSDLLWRGWRQVEAEEREERYRVAYQLQPDTDHEQAWAEAAAADLLGQDDPGWPDAEPPTGAAS
jgi:metal-responsive CopG/Arc/MetJ family transcriptional regulator